MRILEGEEKTLGGALLGWQGENVLVADDRHRVGRGAAAVEQADELKPVRVGAAQQPAAGCASR